MCFLSVKEAMEELNKLKASILQKNRRWQCLSILTLMMLFAACPAYCIDFFVSPDGDDNNDGSIDSPFKTIGKAVEQVLAGDTIFLRGGVHIYTNKISITKSGEAENLITLRSYQDEVPVLDFEQGGDGDSDRGIVISGSYWHFNGFIIQYAGDNGLNVNGGSYNILERLVTRMNGDSGLQLHTASSYNLVIDCDSYLNYDARRHGENADGFAAKFTLGPGNAFVGCRSWSNSDDGFDFWEAYNGVTVVDCRAFRNGKNIWGDTEFEGDGNGFKLGHGVGAHLLIWCMAYNNPHNGIDVNGNATGVTVYNCTSVMNDGRNFNFDEHSSAHVLRNNLSYLGSVTIYTEIDDEYNSWNGFPVSAADFASLDSTGIDGPREPDGGLPKLAFLLLSTDSLLIDAGIDVGLAFQGDYPDLGAFEHLVGDCEPDGDVDLDDLDCLASNWMDVNCGNCNGADSDYNGKVDFYDFNKLASNWLEY